MRIKKIRIIIVTDGDRFACRVVETVADMLGLSCLSASGGNPTPLTGRQIVELLQTVWRDPVLVMFDDKGASGFGRGEQALRYVAAHPRIQVLGALAVASNTMGCRGIKPHISIDNQGHWTEAIVDKHGIAQNQARKRLYGDTVDVLQTLPIPFIIGIGDIGKMDECDQIGIGAPITQKAIEAILKRSGVNGSDKKNLPPP